MGVAPGESYGVTDLLTGSSWTWGERNYVRLDPAVEPAHILLVTQTHMKNGNNNGLPDDPLWYKDAIFYELRVRSFYDSNGDGVGDFPGLTRKLDYLRDLGITTHLAAPVLSVADARRRLRHLRLYRRASRLRHAARFQGFPARRA